MNNPKLKYCEKEDILQLAIFDKPESRSIEVKPKTTAELYEKEKLISIEIFNTCVFNRD
jgi:hypothetical protein